MRSILGVSAAIALAAAPAAAQPETAEEILDAVDDNLTFESRTARITMTVEGPRTRTFEIVVHSRGEEETAVEYLAPERERGQRLLLLGDDLWLYLPQVDRVQRISGAMLRQGMSGSDISYEDMLTARELRDLYDARLIGDDTVEGRACWRLELTAHDDTVSYPRRTMCIDQETYLPLEQDLFALSGLRLKTWTMSEPREFGDGRIYPTRMTIQDHLRPDTVTRVELDRLEFDVEHPPGLFSLAWLEEGVS